ncbi:MAG TPA: hypothetical protein VD995_15795 [Azospirillum sp.]|nr:hypothetical protein [Azospirillum sp.]
MEALVAGMCMDFTGIRKEARELGSDRTNVCGDLGSVRGDLARLDGRVSQLPTTWQLLTGVVGIIAFVFLLLRVGLPR